MKPVMDGNRLVKVVGRKPGPWMKEALRELVKWQFECPGASEDSCGIGKVLSRFNE